MHIIVTCFYFILQSLLHAQSRTVILLPANPVTSAARHIEPTNYIYPVPLTLFIDGKKKFNKHVTFKRASK